MIVRPPPTPSGLLPISQDKHLKPRAMHLARIIKPETPWSAFVRLENDHLYVLCFHCPHRLSFMFVLIRNHHRKQYIFDKAEACKKSPGCILCTSIRLPEHCLLPRCISVFSWLSPCCRLWLHFFVLFNVRSLFLYFYCWYEAPHVASCANPNNYF